MIPQHLLKRYRGLRSRHEALVVEPAQGHTVKLPALSNRRSQSMAGAEAILNLGLDSNSNEEQKVHGDRQAINDVVGDPYQVHRADPKGIRNRGDPYSGSILSTSRQDTNSYLFQSNNGMDEALAIEEAIIGLQGTHHQHRRAISTLRGSEDGSPASMNTKPKLDAHYDASWVKAEYSDRHRTVEKGRSINADEIRQLRRLALKNIYTQRSQSNESEGDGKKVQSGSGQVVQHQEELADVILQFSKPSQELDHTPSLSHLDQKFSDQYGLIPKEPQNQDLDQILSVSPIQFENQMISDQTKDFQPHPDSRKGEFDAQIYVELDDFHKEVQAMNLINNRTDKATVTMDSINTELEKGQAVIQNQNKALRGLQKELKHFDGIIMAAQGKEELARSWRSSTARDQPDLGTLKKDSNQNTQEGFVYDSMVPMQDSNGLQQSSTQQKKSENRKSNRPLPSERGQWLAESPSQSHPGIHTRSQINLRTKKANEQRFKTRYRQSAQILHQVTNVQSSRDLETLAHPHYPSAALAGPEMVQGAGPTHHKVALHQKKDPNQNNKVHKLRGIKVGTQISRNRKDHTQEIKESGSTIENKADKVAEADPRDEQAPNLGFQDDVEQKAKDEERGIEISHEYKGTAEKNQVARQRQQTTDINQSRHEDHAVGADSSRFVVPNANSDAYADAPHDSYDLTFLMQSLKAAQQSRQNELPNTLKKKLGTLRDNSADGGNGGGHGGGMEEKKDKYVEKLKQERKLTSGHWLRLCDRSIKLKPKTLSQYNLNANYQKGQINREYLNSKRTDSFQDTSWLETLVIKRMKSNSALSHSPAKPKHVQGLRTERESAPALNFKLHPVLGQMTRHVNKTSRPFEQNSNLSSFAYGSMKYNRQG